MYTDEVGDGEEDGALSEDIENDEADDNADDATAAANNTETPSVATGIGNEAAAANIDVDENQPSTSSSADNTKPQQSTVIL